MRSAETQIVLDELEGAGPSTIFVTFPWWTHCFQWDREVSTSEPVHRIASQLGDFSPRAVPSQKGVSRMKKGKRTLNTFLLSPIKHRQAPMAYWTIYLMSINSQRTKLYVTRGQFPWSIPANSKSPDSPLKSAMKYTSPCLCNLLSIFFFTAGIWTAV